MSKKEIEIEGVKHIVEFMDDELIDSIEISKPGIKQKLIELLGGKVIESEKTEKKGVKAESDELKAFKEAYTEDMKSLKETLAALAQQKVDESKQAVLTKSQELIQKAVQDGKIAKGEIPKWEEKFKGLYKSDMAILEDALNSRQVDEKLKTDNQRESDPNGKDDSTESFGTPSFTREQLRDTDFYEKNQENIQKAQAAGTITD